MFTGIIQAVGQIRRSEPRGEDMRLTIATGALQLAGTNIGDSIAVNGVCLTAIELGADSFAADVSRESLVRTSLADLKAGDPVNLEKALTLGTPLGGHLVSGHVDGLGECIDRRPDGRSERFRIRAPENLARYIAEKGSITVDGVSLTVNGVDGAVFDINLVPHTLEVTTLQHLRPGRKVNLEVDLIARYLERLMLGSDAATAGAEGGITLNFLAEHGFLKR